MAKTLSLEELREALDYNPETGVFVWKKRLSNRITIGRVAGRASKHGTCEYNAIGCHGRLYLAHRLAWLYMTGEWPKEDIDHIDGDGMNNKWSNLRAASRSQNNMNRHRVTRFNKNGYRGVLKQTKSGRYAANLGRDGYLGTFDTPQEAHAAYVKAAVERFGEFARLD